MGQMIEFSSDRGPTQGYLAAPPEKGPGIVVIQEWWGLVDHVKDVADRFAAQGYVALAPDLYNGEVTREPDEAHKLLMEMELDDAVKAMRGAVNYLRYNPMVDPNKIGSVGWCMGGGLSLVLAASEDIDACVTFYGLPGREVDFSRIEGAVLGHFAEHDEGITDRSEEVFGVISQSAAEAEMYIYPGTVHAFFNDSRPETYNAEAAELAWTRTLDFFGKHLS